MITPRPANMGLPPFGTKALICGLAGETLSTFEEGYLADVKPWGVILFGRNIQTPDQVRALCASVRQVLGWQAPILIDQEGGRVQRLRPPYWDRYPPAGRLGAMEVAQPGSGVEAAQIAAWMIADDLLSLGIDVNCAPVLDLRLPGGTNAIGNRAYHGRPDVVATLARAVHDAYLQAGVLPVVKHVPGHGRAQVDSHATLPFIGTDLATLEATDFAPFRALRDAALAMTGHLVFQAIDPQQPVTLSPIMIGLIRNQIGFTGALMSDDLSMGALSGSLGSRAQKSVEAGCDLALHCNGVPEEMRQIADAVPELSGQSAVRCASALARRGAQSIERSALSQRLDSLLAGFQGHEDDGMVDPTEAHHA